LAGYDKTHYGIENNTTTSDEPFIRDLNSPHPQKRYAH